MPALAPLLRRFRERAGLTQDELAERAGLSTRTISDAERGLRTRLYADTAGRLADALALAGPDRETFLATARGRVEPETDAAVGRLPHPLTPLLGRAEEVATLEAALDPGASGRLVTVTGLGGSGKTRVAIAAADRLKPRYGDNVRFLALAGMTVDQLPDAIATVLSTVSSRIPLAVGDRPTLLVLDAFEHVHSSAEWLGRLLEQTTGLRALVTSRQRLWVPGERELTIGPLSADDAALLFLERARDRRSDLAADHDAVAEICRLTSALPLPLELAAAQLSYVPLHLLRDRLRIGLTDATQVVRDAVAWSISSLSDLDRRVLAGAAMFAGGCRLDALEAVCEPHDVVPSVGRLADKSLLVLDEDGPVPRWRMLDAVREAALALIDPGLARREAYITFYLRFLTDVGRQLGHEHAWYRQLAAEETNVRTALGWAQESGDANTLLTLATGMWLYWQARGALHEGRRWLSSGLAMTPAADPGLRKTALWGLAWLAYHQGDDPAAHRAGEELAQLAGEDDLAQRNAATIAGMVAIARDEPNEAIELLTDALRIARTLDNRWILATSLLNLGLAHLAAQSSAEARALLGEALRHYDEIGDLRFRARCVGYLGLASLLEHGPERAHALFVQSLLSFRDLAEPAGTAEALAGLAAVAASTGAPATAALLGGAAERIRDSVAARELPVERRIAERYLGDAAERIGPQAWAEAWRRGRDRTLDEIVTELGLETAAAAQR